MVQSSLSEISALAQKAASGAGMFWGLAEETGRAVRWLEAHELPGLAMLAELLVLNDAKPYADLAAVSTTEIWQAQRGDLCPIITGTALSDRVTWFREGDALELAGTSYPLLLLPFIARVAEVVERPLTLAWSGMEIRCTQTALIMLGSVENLGVHRAERVIISKPQHSQDQNGQSIKSTHTGAVTVATSVWQNLEAFAHRTYVPASAASRQSGAGAGLIDND